MRKYFKESDCGYYYLVENDKILYSMAIGISATISRIYNIDSDYLNDRNVVEVSKEIFEKEFNETILIITKEVNNDTTI